MSTIAAIQSRVAGAVQQLTQADRKNPETHVTAEQLRNNPFVTPKGDNGAVDQTEAKTLAGTFAKSVFEAASFQTGRHVLEGGTSTGFHPAVLPSYGVNLGQLRNVQSHLEAITASLQTDGKGEVTAAALEQLPQTVRAYFDHLPLPTRDRPADQTIEKLANVIREAANHTVEWK